MIAPEGWPFILIPICGGAAALVLGWSVFGGVLIAIGAFGLLFFRNPRRSCGAPGDVACSPADGKVIKIGSSPDAIADLGLPLQVSVFMNVFNVHVNRAPLDGALLDYSYNPGKKLAAFKDKASTDNEQNLSLWQGPAGRIALKQIAGTVARRIVFDHQVGRQVRRSDRIGLIRYGSRVDVFLPGSAEVLVHLGDRVRAGETPFARMVATQGAT